MTALGHGQKNSQRGYVFCIAPGRCWKRAHRPLRSAPFADVAAGPKAVTEERTFIDIMLKTGWAAATPLPLAFGH